MVAEALAVVADDDNHRAVVEAERLELGDDAADLAVGEGNLAVVRVSLVTRRERLGRVVGRVRVVEVDPGEERRALRVPNPRQGLVHDLVAGPLDVRQRHAALPAEVEVVEVGVESLVDPPLAVEHVRADEPAGAVAPRLQDLGERELFGAEEEAAVVAHAVLGRELAGEQARVRRQGERRDGLGLLEQHALAGQVVEGRRLDVAIAVGPHAVGPRRVEGHHHQVQRLSRHAARQRPEVDAAFALVAARVHEPRRHAGGDDERAGRGKDPAPGRRSGLSIRRWRGPFSHAHSIVTRDGRRRQCGGEPHKQGSGVRGQGSG